MARIAGINIPPHKHAEIGLTAIYGIGRTRARKICDACGIPYSKKIKDLTDADQEKIRDQIAQLIIEGDLRRETTMNIKRLMDIGCYRAPRNHDEHQALDGHRLLSRLPPPPRPAAAWSAHAYQCPYPQGPAQGCCRPEEIKRLKDQYGQVSCQ